MKRLFLLLAAALLSVGTILAQDTKTCSGTIIDEQGEPVIGATVFVKGTTTAVATDIDGAFSLKVPKSTKNLEITYVGYKPVTVPAVENVGQIRLEPDSQMLQDVVITQSIAKTRQTPVAISEITAGDIEAKLGNQEFPEVLKTTPGVYATPTGGGFGDAKINMRGFKAANVAVLVNGIPMNDMEWGGIYWSNFAGLSDVTSSMQTQRGLGASLLSAPSVGGTVNITTKMLDSKKGGRVWYGMGNDNLNNIGFTVSTGMMNNGWAITILGSRRWSDKGYVQGTKFDSYNWFVNITKRINDDHQIGFTAFGTPQWHFQRNSTYGGLTIEGWQQVRDYMGGESPYRYNPTYGFDNEGRERTAHRNSYHKPVMMLNHIWQINERSSLSTGVYASIGTGRGYSGQGRGTYNGTSLSYSSWQGATNGQLNWLFRRADGTFDYGAIQDMNAASTTGSNMVMSSSNNNHEWYGLVSTYKNEIIPTKLTITGGIDFRYYVGHHNNKIIDLYSGEYYMDDGDRKNVLAENNAAAADPNWKYQKLGVGDIVYRDYDGHTHQEGVYAQGEYKLLDGAITTILAGSLSNTGYQRVDRFYYDKAHGTSDWHNFLGGTVKAGANWNIDRHNNVFINGGFISKVPFFSYGVFLNSNSSNVVNPDTRNEKIGTIEIGYGYKSPSFSATLNAYYTEWKDKSDRSTVKTGTIPSGDLAGQMYSLALAGVAARHMGIEVNFKWIPAKWVDVDGMLSLGDWTWNSNSKGYYYTNGQPMTAEYGIASGVLASDHAWSMMNQKGVKVGDSAQTTGFIGVNFKPFKGFRIGADWVMQSNLYSNQYLSGNSMSVGYGNELKVADPWKVPWGNQLDLSASYNFKIGGVNATLYGNVYNLFNYYYVKDAETPALETGTWQNAYSVFYSFGRTFSLRLKLTF